MIKEEDIVFFLLKYGWVILVVYVLIGGFFFFNIENKSESESTPTQNESVPFADFDGWRTDNASVCAHLDYLINNGTQLQVFHSAISTRTELEASGMRILQVNASDYKLYGVDEGVVYCGLRLDACFDTNLCSDGFMMVVPVNLTEYEDFIQYIKENQ